MARFTGIAGTSGGNGSALNFVQNKVAQPVSVTGYPTTIAAVTITTTGKPVQISLTGEGSNAQAGSWVRLNIFRDGTAVGNTIQIEASAVSENVPYAINVIDEVDSGQYVYEAIITSMSAGNWSFGEVTGPIMNAVELTGFKGDTGAQGPQGEPGAQGEAGTDATGGLVYLGDYVSGNGYVADIAVVRGSDNNLYIAKQSGGLLSPIANPGQWDMFSDNSSSGTGPDLVIPFVMKDENGNDLLGFEKGGTGVTRINALQDDLALRSSNDIILYPGDDGPGSVYIGWGDATYTPDATNRVATIADVQAATGLGDFAFTAGTATVNENETLKITANDSDEVRAQLVLDPNNAIVKLEAFTNQNSNTFYSSNPDWDSSTWVTDGGNGSIITFVNAPNIINFMSTQFNLLNNVKISVNGGTSGTWNGGSYGSSDITIYIDGVLPPEDTTINDFSFLYNEVSLIEINQDNGEINIQTQSGNDINISAGDDMYITAQEDDLFLRANDDIRFISRYNDPNFSEQQWRMNSEGQFEFPGSGYIENVIDGSGDGYGNDTFKIVPDDDLVSGNGSDQYLIIDPTSPNHIHIRAGGTQDESQAYLILGGERTNVQVSDQDGNVRISSKQPDITYSLQNLNPESSNLLIVEGEFADIDWNWFVQYNGTKYGLNGYYTQNGQTFITQYDIPFETGGYYLFGYTRGENNWNFSSNGTLYGPEEGNAIVVPHIVGEPGNNIFNVIADQNLVLKNGEGYGAYLDNSNDGLNQIATIGDLNESIANANGNLLQSVRWTPNFTATGLTFTGSGATHPTYNSHYVKQGQLVSFWIAVDCSTVTSFGTGQLNLELPFAPLAGTMNHFSGWVFVDETANPDMAGHIIVNADHLPNTQTLDLHYIKQQGGANSPVMEAMLMQNTPVVLTTATNIYINGTYIAQ